MKQEQFYAECAAIIGTEHTYEDKRPTYLRYDRTHEVFYLPPTKAGRFSGREPGNGRFVGFGTVRDFGSTIHVSLRNPINVTRSFADYPSTLAFLRRTFQDNG